MIELATIERLEPRPGGLAVATLGGQRYPVLVVDRDVSAGDTVLYYPPGVRIPEVELRALGLDPGELGEFLRRQYGFWLHRSCPFETKDGEVFCGFIAPLSVWQGTGLDTHEPERHIEAYSDRFEERMHREYPDEDGWMPGEVWVRTVPALLGLLGVLVAVWLVRNGWVVSAVLGATILLDLYALWVNMRRYHAAHAEVPYSDDQLTGFVTLFISPIAPIVGVLLSLLGFYFVFSQRSFRLELSVGIGRPFILLLTAHCVTAQLFYLGLFLT